MRIKKRFIVFGSSLWLFAACNLVPVSPTPQPTIPILPANTSMPATPAQTMQPPAVLTEYLENVRIVKVDSFDDPSEWNPGTDISNGTLVLVGSGSSWHGLSNTAIFQEGEGIVINFMFTPDGFFEMYLEHGPWPTQLYKRFGIYVQKDRANTNVFVGRELTDFVPIPGNLSLRSGDWYSLFMVVGRGGDFVAQIWDPANPEHFLRFREVIGSWKEVGWTFRIQVNRGRVTFDDFQAITFDAIK